jgi:Fe-S cluster assembly iron-binding protein IscA
MLALTDTAATAVRKLVEAGEVDTETGGIRISSSGETAGEGMYSLALVDGPETTDEEISQGGAHVFVEQAVEPALTDKVLDATVEEGRVRFMLFQRRDG